VKALIKSFAKGRKSVDALDIILLLAMMIASSFPLILLR
jgi:hypothetical protein